MMTLPEQNPKLLIFTDLDGTLLNHHDYSYNAAKPALEIIRAHAIPLIICTSKTRSEVSSLKNELGLHDPYVTENGGGIFIPENCVIPAPEDAIISGGEYCILLGKRYHEIRQVFNGMKERYAVKGFGDMDTEEIVQLTGLNAEQAEKAKQREFTEPFVIRDNRTMPWVDNMASEADMRIVKGGRFYHLIGPGQDKGRAVRRIIDLYRDIYRRELITIGAGDSRNDFDMLKTVQYPVLIPRHDGKYEDFDLPHLIKAPYPGAKGWNESILTLMKQFKIIR